MPTLCPSIGMIYVQKIKEMRNIRLMPPSIRSSRPRCPTRDLHRLRLLELLPQQSKVLNRLGKQRKKNKTFVNRAVMIVPP